MRRFQKIFSKKWVELTLCDMVDEVMQSLKNNNSKEEMMQIIKKYSSQIDRSQDNDDDKK